MLLLAWACTRDPRGGPPRATPTGTSETAATDSAPLPEPPGTASTGETGAGTGHTGLPPDVFDCATIGAPSAYDPEIPGARGYTGLGFDGLGSVYGTDWNGILQSADAAGAVTEVLLGTGGANQMVVMPDGRLFMAQSGALTVVDLATGAHEFPLFLPSYGVILGPDGFLYVVHDFGTSPAISRFDPATGVSTAWLELGQLARGEPRVIAFSPDHATMYVGTGGGWLGRVYRIPLDANLDPAGPPTVLAEGVGDGNRHDGLVVDACGYLYVSDEGTRALYRVHPVSGAVEVLQDTLSGVVANYGAGLAFGRGPGFSETSLYLTKPFDRNKVARLSVDVPGAGWAGAVLHAPQ